MSIALSIAFTGLCALIGDGDGKPGQILLLKGFVHPARFNVLAKQNKLPKALLNALPPAATYAKAKFASLGQQSAAKAKIATDWPSKIGS